MLVALIPFAKDEKFEFVELGCGTGEPSRKVLEHFPRARGTCVDSGRMAQGGRRNI